MAPTRPLIIGPATGPEPPFPLHMEGKVIRGFGRGSRELGIPTANLPIDESLRPWIADIKSGVYFGWASLGLSPECPNERRISSDTIPTRTTTTAATTVPAEERSGFSVYPMVMSIGYNRFYKNTVRSAEVHVLHDFGPGFTFYGAEMRVLIVGFVREERDYDGVGALVEDIKGDCEVVRRSLEREEWAVREMGGGRLDGSWLVREVGGGARGVSRGSPSCVVGVGG